MTPTRVLLLFFLTRSKVTAEASSQTQFQLTLKRFHRAIPCPEPCRIQFRICLTHYQTDIDFHVGCTFGEKWTTVRNPVSLPMDFKWPRTFSLIVDAFLDTNEPQGTPMTRMVLQTYLESGLVWIGGVFNDLYSNLEYEFRLVCGPHYFGINCDTFCRPRDDPLGHFTCGPEGQKVCMNGYEKNPNDPEGDYCTQAICSPDCHLEHGSCVSPGECKCENGWTGETCDTCVRYPGCQHGTCNTPWTCQCDEGWGGLLCDQDLNFCTNNRPCVNGATCLNTGLGSYTCNCPFGYFGINCELRRTMNCEHQPCKNGGSCIDLFEDYSCDCPPGLTGRHCQDDIDDCLDTPCQNGGTCFDLVNNFVCKCMSGFVGSDCSKELNPCDPSPCLNQGVCVNLIYDFECQCLPGFTGKTCWIFPDSGVMEKHQTPEGSNFTLAVALFTIFLVALVISASTYSDRDVERNTEMKNDHAEGNSFSNPSSEMKSDHFCLPK